MTLGESPGFQVQLKLALSQFPAEQRCLAHIENGHCTVMTGLALPLIRTAWPDARIVSTTRVFLCFMAIHFCIHADLASISHTAILSHPPTQEFPNQYGKLQKQTWLQKPLSSHFHNSIMPCSNISQLGESNPPPGPQDAEKMERKNTSTKTE